jgi:hypothetical protein
MVRSFTNHVGEPGDDGYSGVQGIVIHTTVAPRAPSTSAAASYSDRCHASSAGVPGAVKSDAPGSSRNAISQTV